MAQGLYANKFLIELNDVARIVFIDEHAPLAAGVPMASTVAAEIVMTHDNLKALYNSISTILQSRGELL